MRALRALLLLAGFHLLGVLLLAVLTGIDHLLYSYAPSSVAVKPYLVSVFLAVPLVRGLFMLRTPKADEPPGLPVTKADEPEPWRTVREPADRIGTRAPSRIPLVPDANAAVAEDARLLGLLPGPRRLHLGVPLPQDLTEAQLRSVIAHEPGHYSNADTRLVALTVRGRTQILNTIRHFEERAGKTAAREQARQEKKSAEAAAKGRRAGEVDIRRVGVTYRAMARIHTAYAKPYFRATLAGARDLLSDPERTLEALGDAAPTEGVRRFRRTADRPELLNGSMAAQLADPSTPPHRAPAAYTRAHPILPALLVLPLIARFEHDESDDAEGDRTPEVSEVRSRPLRRDGPSMTRRARARPASTWSPGVPSRARVRPRSALVHEVESVAGCHRNGLRDGPPAGR